MLCPFRSYVVSKISHQRFSISMFIVASFDYVLRKFAKSKAFCPFQIRNVGMTIVVFISYLILFGFLKILPHLLDTIDVHGCMVMFATLSMLGIVFVATVLKETNGQSLDDVGLNEMMTIENVRARSLSIG